VRLVGEQAVIVYLVERRYPEDLHEEVLLAVTYRPTHALSKEED
jgi:hypothetical protein